MAARLGFRGGRLEVFPRLIQRRLHRLRIAEVNVLNFLSAHAGRSELIDFGKRFKDRAEKVPLVHGENGALAALQSGLQAEGCTNTHIQEEGVPVEF